MCVFLLLMLVRPMVVDMMCCQFLRCWQTRFAHIELKLIWPEPWFARSAGERSPIISRLGTRSAERPQTNGPDLCVGQMNFDPKVNEHFAGYS